MPPHPPPHLPPSATTPTPGTQGTSHSAMTACCRPRGGGEDGAITVFVVALALAFMMVAGLVYDGGRVLVARRLAHDVADNAARAGAQAVDLDALRGGGVVALAPLEAEIAARDYLADVGHDGDVAVTADRIAVTVSVTAPMVLLQIGGVPDRMVTGRGEARLVRGVTGAES